MTKTNVKQTQRSQALRPVVDKIPPQNIEAEQSLLGALLLDKEAIYKVVDHLRPDDFYREQHQIIYGALLEIYAHHTPIDMITITNQLEKSKKLTSAGGASYLTSLTSSVPSAAHVEHYGKIVSQKAILRRLISASQQISELAYDEGGQSETILDKSESILFSVSERLLQKAFIPIKSVLTDSFDRIDQLHKQKGKLRGVPTGFIELDRLLSGFQASDLIVIAARPSMGKTTLALNIALNAAIESKLTVAIFSLEMSKEQLVDRLICSHASIDSWKLRTGNLSDDDFARIGPAIGALSEAPVFIDDSATLNCMEIRTKARRLHAEHGLGLVVVDYLQLMEGISSRGEPNRVQEISEISRGLKALARELNVPVVAASQLSRAVEQRPNHQPQLADLRESGSIEQDADVVMFIYREDYYDKETERKNITDILIKKHRNGPIGEIELYFEPETLSFKNLETKREG